MLFYVHILCFLPNQLLRHDSLFFNQYALSHLFHAYSSKGKGDTFVFLIPFKCVLSKLKGQGMVGT